MPRPRTSEPSPEPSPPPAPGSPAPMSEAREKGLSIALKIVLTAALVDGVLLVAAAILAIAGSPALTAVGPLYVFGFAYLLYLAATGAMRGRWGWWYLGLVAVTLGPPGAVLGARRLLREQERREAARRAQAAPT